MFREHNTLTKKQLGLLLLIGGILGFLAVFSIDLITITRESGLSGLFSAAAVERLRGPLGIGPAQRLALAACVGAALVGLSLLPLGEKPA